VLRYYHTADGLGDKGFGTAPTVIFRRFHPAIPSIGGDWGDNRNEDHNTGPISAPLVEKARLHRGAGPLSKVLPASLENQLQSELELPWIERQVRRRDLTEGVGTGRMAGRIKRTDIDVGLPEVLRVGEVIDLGPELRPHPAAEIHVLQEPEIEHRVARSTRLVEPGRLGGSTFSMDRGAIPPNFVKED